MQSIGLPELLVILGVAVLLFGGKKIPELAKGLGEGIRNSRRHWLAKTNLPQSLGNKPPPRGV